MAEAKASWYGEATFRKLLLLVAQIWTWVTIGTHVMMMVLWVMVFVQNIDVFKKVNDRYIGNDHNRYDALDGNIGSGYVANTNMPKQLGGAVFASMFAISMWGFILIAAAADVAWRWPSVQRFLLMWHTPGLWSNKNLDELDYYFIFANCFLKLFIVVATGSTSWRGLYPNNPQIDTEVYCLYATFIYLVNILANIAAAVVCVNAIKRAEWPSIFKDLEAKAGTAAVDKHVAAEKEKQKQKSKEGQKKKSGGESAPK